MSEIQKMGDDNPSQVHKLYRQEYHHGATLFEKALHQSRKTSYGPKKKEFDNVMRMAMEILNQTARGLKDERLVEHNKKIAEDYKAYQENPDKEHLDALQENLNIAKDSLS